MVQPHEHATANKYHINGKAWYIWFDYDDNKIIYKYILSRI